MQCQAIKTTVYLWVLASLLSSNYCWAVDWKLEKQKSDVIIYSHKTESGYKEILVETIVKAKPGALIALLDDIAFSSNWIHNCIEVKIIKEVSATERLVNTFFAAPWPVKDRDMVTFSKTTIRNNIVEIKIFDRAQTTPINPKYVRMQNMHGVWQATPLGNGKSKITYTGGGNPGGNLPTFIANKELITSMFKTFQNLNKFISLEKYQPANITE